MAYLSGTYTSGTSSEMFPNFGGEAGTGVSSDSAYGKLLSLFKKFVCGEASEASAGANTGTGLVLHTEPTRGVTTKTWTLTFSSATAFSITASGETTVNGTLTGSAPNRKADISAARFTLSVYEGATAFVSGDSFTFTTTASGLDAGETWDVLADTAKGTAPADYYSDMYTKTLSGTTLSRGGVTGVRYYRQSEINSSFYVTFSSSGTVFEVRRTTAPATVIGTGTVGGATLVIPKVLDITISSGGTAFTNTTYTGPTPTGGNYFTIAPKVSAAGANSNLTRVIVLRHRGYDGSYNIYETIAQRVGNNLNRYFLEGYCHSNYSSSLAMLSQQNISPAWRIKTKNPENSEEVVYHLIADALCAKILILPSLTDPQGCYFGMYEAHGTPSECRFPVFVGGCVFQDVTSIDLDSTAGTSSGPFFWSSDKLCYLFPPGGATGASWIKGNTSGAAVGEANGSSSGTPLEAFYIAPWETAGAAIGVARFHPGVYGELGTKKSIMTTYLNISKTDVLGVAGELSGFYFIDASGSVSNNVTIGDTLTISSKTYLIWRFSNQSTVINSAAILLG